VGNKTSSYVELLETAYDVSEQPERFDDLMTVARRYFFEDLDSARISRSLPRNSEPKQSLDKRTAHLSRLLERELGAPTSAEANTFNAQISISPKTMLVTGNQAATKLTGCAFPCRLDQLQFDHPTLKMIEANLRPRASSQPSEDRIFLALIGEDEPRSCLALVERPVSEDGQLDIAISYIYWSEELLERLSNAFGLTKAQAKVLDGFLNHKSQKDIASERGLSVETVRDHSRAILHKANCARMIDVIQLSASIAYLLREYQQPQDRSSLDVWKTPDDNIRTLDRPNGRSLAWYEYGSGPNAVLFVHGYIQGPFFHRDFVSGLDRLGIRLICPSRPGYGYTSPSQSKSDFEDTTVSDSEALVAALGITELSILAHQGGVSHAFRIANALTDKVETILMLDAGIPIDEKRYLEHMNDFARIGAVACKHTPSVMTLLMNLGLPIWRKRGIEKFLAEYHKHSPIDLESIDDPDIMRLNAFGCFHSMEQGVDAWVNDGRSAMADWESDFDAMQGRQHWLHPKECPVMGAHFVQEFVARKLGDEVEIVPYTAFNILYQRPGVVLDFLERHLQKG